MNLSFLNRRILLLRKKSSEPDSCQNEFEIVLVIDEYEKLLEVSKLYFFDQNIMKLTLNAMR